MAANVKKAMTKTGLISHLAESVGVTKKQATALITELADVAYKQARLGFTVPGIGKLVVVKRKPRMGRNPATGETIKIPAKTVVRFRIAKACKEAAVS